MTHFHLDDMETQGNIVLSSKSIQHKTFHLPNSKIASNRTTIDNTRVKLNTSSHNIDNIKCLGLRWIIKSKGKILQPESKGSKALQ
jgi:hypothetical protein